jgi:ankyrin repeat protein
MSTHGPDDSDGDWVKRYRQASDTDAAMPSPATREAILAEGRRVAAARAANPTTHKFDTKQPAANQSRWKLAATGTVGAALLAAVLMYPHFGAPPTPIVAEIAPRTASAPAPDRQFKKQIEARESVSDAAVEEVVVTGARRAVPQPSRTLARKAQPAPSREAAELGRNADSTLHEAQDTTSNALAGAQTAPPAPAAPAAPSASATSAFLESHAVGGAVLPQSALSASVVSGDAARVAGLLDEGANPEQIDSLGRTPLLLAVIAHREDMVGLLLAHHADPNVSDHSGQTPLQRASLDNQLNIVSLLKRAGAH